MGFRARGPFSEGGDLQPDSPFLSDDRIEVLKGLCDKDGIAPDDLPF